MKNILVFIAVVAIYSECKADSIPRFRVSMEPQYFVLGTFKTAFDLKIGQDDWIVLTARATWREREQPDFDIYYNDDSFLRSWGAGVELAYRKYLNKPEDMARYFFSFNLGYNYYEPVYYRYMWVDYKEDGLNFTTYMPGEDKRQIHQPKGEMAMGTLFRVFGSWFFELNAGGGIKYSMFDKYRGDPENLYRYYWSYGYSGTYFLMGFRIGKEF